MSFDSVIFDLDGTLWDSTAACAVSWNVAVQKLNLPNRNFEPKDVAGIMGMPHQKIYEKMFPSLTEEKREEIATHCYDEEIKHLQQAGSPLYPGVEAGLQRLSQRYPLFLLSNCLVEYLETFLKVTQFSRYFKDSLCHGHTGEGKAHNMRLLTSKHGLKRAVYVGDTTGDHLSAQEAGLTYIHVTYGFGEPAGPCKMASSFPELIEFLMKEGAE